MSSSQLHCQCLFAVLDTSLVLSKHPLLERVGLVVDRVEEGFFPLVRLDGAGIIGSKLERAFDSTSPFFSSFEAQRSRDRPRLQS